MELKDFTEKEKEQINAGLSTAEISDQETAEKSLPLYRKDGLRRFPSLSASMQQQRRLNESQPSIPNFTQPQKNRAKSRKRSGKSFGKSSPISSTKR